MTDQLELAWSVEARGQGHRIPVLVPDIAEWPADPAPAWALDGLPAAWWQFHLAHPEVADGLARLARPLLARGYRHLGIAMLWETLRYRTLLGAKVPGEDDYRLNNNHRAYYARWLMEQHPDLAGVFEVRSSQAESLDAPED